MFSLTLVCKILPWFFSSSSFSSAFGSVPRRWHRPDPGRPGPRVPQVRKTNRDRARTRAPKLDQFGANDPMRNFDPDPDPDPNPNNLFIKKNLNRPNTDFLFGNYYFIFYF